MGATFRCASSSLSKNGHSRKTASTSSNAGASESGSDRSTAAVSR